jgi:hypothetical protein
MGSIAVAAYRGPAKKVALNEWPVSGSRIVSLNVRVWATAVTKTDFTGWRYYTGMPDTATLKRDMVEALGGSAAPIFRNEADGKTQIFVPKR